MYRLCGLCGSNCNAAEAHTNGVTGREVQSRREVEVDAAGNRIPVRVVWAKEWRCHLCVAKYESLPVASYRTSSWSPSRPWIKHNRNGRVTKVA